MITVRQALEIVAHETIALRFERVELENAVNRILAEPIVADTDLPPFDRSQMDGYAVRTEDFTASPTRLRIVGESAAGRGWHKRIRAGEAVRIMTGAPLPPGADAVQKLEVASEDGEIVTITDAPKPGQYFLSRGREVRKGDVVLDAGLRMSPAVIAVAASFGYAKVKVAKRPRVAILSTGSEIVDIAAKPGRDQIRNSNSIMLAGYCRRDGAEVTVLPTASDNFDELLATIRESLKKADVLITTGGVSVGKYDLTKAALARLGAEILFERIRLKPGKPTVFARYRNKLIFGLPGNPVSAAVTYRLFVRRAILKMQSAAKINGDEATAIVPTALKAPKERDWYVPATLSVDAKARLVAEPIQWYGSSDIAGFSRANALIRIERNSAIRKGSLAPIVLLEPPDFTI